MSDSNWLERELQTHLRPVAAPAELWAKIQTPQQVSRGRLGVARFVWPVVAVLLLLASADLLWEFSQARGGSRQFSRPNAAELAAISPDQCDLWSSDPAHIRKWVKSRSGIDITLPPHSPSVRVMGAKVVNLRGTLVASITYEAAGEHRGSMLVWKEGREHTQHAPPVRTAELVSWSQGDNVFAVSAADDVTARAACMLCHPEGTHGI